MDYKQLNDDCDLILNKYKDIKPSDLARIFIQKILYEGDFVNCSTEFYNTVKNFPRFNIVYCVYTRNEEILQDIRKNYVINIDNPSSYIFVKTLIDREIPINEHDLAIWSHKNKTTEFMNKEKIIEHLFKSCDIFYLIEYDLSDPIYKESFRQLAIDSDTLFSKYCLWGAEYQALIHGLLKKYKLLTNDNIDSYNLSKNLNF